MHSQMLKGVLEGCILYIISQEEVYGYELSTKLNQYGFTFVSEGSIYPLLLRMQKEKLIEGTLKTSNLGPKRKYYHLTKKGLEQLEVSKVLLRLFNLLQHNGRKSHRYKKKTVFDILGVVYEYITSTHQVA